MSNKQMRSIGDRMVGDRSPIADSIADHPITRSPIP